MQILLNLATRPYFNRRAMTFWLMVVGAGLGLLLLINLSYALQNYHQSQQIDLRLKELNQQLAEAHGLPVAEFDPKEYARTLEQVSIANEIVFADRFRWTHLLTRLEELVPGDVKIKMINPNFKSGDIKINAVARDVSGLTEFLDRLLSSPDYKQVFLSSQSEVEQKSLQGAATTVVSFSLEIKEAF
jgi:Tfp pilus assembly protein PilN